MAETNLAKLKTVLSSESITKKFQDMLGKKSAGFLTSVSSVVSNSALLQKADVNSIILAAGQAAALDLPINPNLGYASIIPYENRREGTCTATFQIQRNGWVELCMRTGLVASIVNEVVYEGQLVKKNKFTGEYVFDEDAKTSDKVIGYMAYIRLTNGFEKTEYMTSEECKQHGLKYSQTFKFGKGLWATDFDVMSKKTVLKRLITKYVPKSIELAMAIESDQAAFGSGEIGNAKPTYVDNGGEIETVDFEEVTEESNEPVETKSPSVSSDGNIPFA